MIAPLAWLWNGFKPYIFGGVAIIVAMLYAFGRIKQIGVDEQKAREAKADAQLQQKMGRIDTSNLSVDDAFKRLRDRSGASNPGS